MAPAGLAWITSPLGRLRLSSDGAALTGVQFHSHGIFEPARPDAVIEQAEAELREYFDGRRRRFEVALALHGSPFQLKVWRALREIPYATTASYGEIARRIGEPGAARAVGLANNRNPIALIVPCHRVIGATGRLVGYGGGLAAKDWLLRHECEIAGPQPALHI
jgi:methylated-DNA-[protein]-cysteine S-methyltransferase